MKHKIGDKVHILSLDKEGIVIHTEGTKEHPYYVSFDENKDADFFAETDLDPSKVLDDPTIINIIQALHQYSEQVMPQYYGLPVINDKNMAEMVALVRNIIHPAVLPLPERREQPRIFTDLDKKIAEDAALFEQMLGVHPERQDSTALSWGWRYVSDTIQKQFREYCNDRNNQTT